MRYAMIQGYLISNILYLISKLGEGIKNTPSPEIQGWDTEVFHGSTLVAFVRKPLIDALTGAPV